MKIDPIRASRILADGSPAVAEDVDAERQDAPAQPASRDSGPEKMYDTEERARAAPNGRAAVLTPEAIARLRERVEEGFYGMPDVLNEVAARILGSGDVSTGSLEGSAWKRRRYDEPT